MKYRKLFGLASYIGLSDRDRFELSGDDLRDWLTNPKRGKEILMRNLGGQLEDGDEEEPSLDTDDLPSAPPEASTIRPQTLFESIVSEADDAGEAERRMELASSRAPTSSERTLDELRDIELRSIVLGLGFEDRTLASAERLLERVRPAEAVLVRYDEKGHADEIERRVRERVDRVDILDYRSLGPAADALPPPGPCLVDVTGLAKPMIFQAVRRALSREGRVFVAHTQAQIHYPLDEAIEPVLAAEKNSDVWALLDGLDGVWLGEAGPYSFEQLLLTDADESR